MLLQRLAEDQAGQDLVEYALLAALIAIACIAAMDLLSGEATNIFNGILDALKTA